MTNNIKKNQQKKKTTSKTALKQVPKNKKRKKKAKFNIFKFIRALIIIAVIIFIIHSAFNYIFSKKVPAPPSPAQIAAQQQVSAAKAAKVTAEINTYKSKQLNLLHNLFRFNQNLYLCMSNTTANNIYPDSQNAVKALQDNFNAFSSNLPAADMYSETEFFAKLSTLNNAYIANILAYNKEALSQNASDKQLSILFKPLQASYNAVNKFMNDNMNKFQ